MQSFNFVLFFCCFQWLCTAFPIATVTPSFDPFSWTDHGSFIGNGSYYFYGVYPPVGSIAPYSGAYFALDALYGRYIIGIVAPTPALPYGVVQIGLANGTYFTESDGHCYYNPTSNYADFLTVYSAATVSRNSGDFLHIKNYVGLVNDPGTCESLAGVNVIKRDDGVILQYTADSLVNFAFGSCAVGKLGATLAFSQWSWGVPAASYFQLPPICYSAADYCSNFSPASCSFHTPL